MQLTNIPLGTTNWNEVESTRHTGKPFLTPNPFVLLQSIRLTAKYLFVSLGSIRLTAKYLFV
jgi:hypothetical protein